MSILKALLMILGLVALLMCIPIGVDVGYCQGKTRCFLRIGPLTIGFRPAIPKKKNRKRKAQPAQAPTQAQTEQPEAEKRGFPDVTRDEVLDGVSVAVRAIRKLRLHLHKLKLHLISAFADPYQTAMVYGYANAAVYALGLDRMKQADVQLAVDFQREECFADIYVSLTIRIYQILKCVFSLVGGALPILWRRRKRRKAEQNSGAVKGMVA